MNKSTVLNLYYYSALVCSIWFALSASAWTNHKNLIISLPFGLIALGIYIMRRKHDVSQERYKAIPIIISIGVLISAMVYYLVD
jgi:flagellar biosynthesis regulator FlaF